MSYIAAFILGASESQIDLLRPYWRTWKEYYKETNCCATFKNQTFLYAWFDLTRWQIKWEFDSGSSPGTMVKNCPWCGSSISFPPDFDAEGNLKLDRNEVLGYNTTPKETLCPSE